MLPRLRLLSVGLALLSHASLGCHGDTVETPTSDAAVDAALETGDPVDAADAAADPCRPTGNLVEGGDFTTGTAEWLVDRATLTVGAGPCSGKGATVKTTGGYGSIGRRVDRAVSKGLRLHLRGYVRVLATTRAPPQFDCRAIRRTDAGEVVQNLVALTASGGPGDWVLLDKTFTLDADALGFMVSLASGTSDVPDEFGVAGVSLSVE